MTTTMSRRALSLALLSLCAPVAFAHPPCPQDPVEIDPVLSQPDTSTPAYLSVSTSFVGDSAVLTALRRHSKDIINTGNCRTGDTNVEFPGPASAGPALGIQPPYAVRAGFGMLGLPDPHSAPLGTTLIYSLEFKLAQRSLPAGGDWVDVMQFEFRPSNASDPGNTLPSTLYRMRVRSVPSQYIPTALEFIEVRRTGQDSTPVTERIVARLPLDYPDKAMPLVVQWRQFNRGPVDAVIIDPPDDGLQTMSMPQAGTDDIGIVGIIGDGSIANGSVVDSIFEIIGPNGSVLHHANLPEQWAESLQFGLLNYHSPSIPASVLTPAAYTSQETLSVKILP